MPTQALPFGIDNGMKTEVSIDKAGRMQTYWACGDGCILRHVGFGGGLYPQASALRAGAADVGDHLQDFRQLAPDLAVRIAAP
jgi:hypothetical protein